MASKGFIAGLAGIALAAGLAYKGVEYKSTHDGPLKIIENNDVSEALSDKKAAVYAGAVWCHPCKQFLPIVKKKAWFSGADWYYLDIDKNTDAAKRLGIVDKDGKYSVPEIVFLKKGTPVAELNGTATEKELENKIKEAYR
jgi:thioredoxin-like negative regulator of GroEL